VIFGDNNSLPACRIYDPGHSINVRDDKSRTSEAMRPRGFSANNVSNESNMLAAEGRDFVRRADVGCSQFNRKLCKLKLNAINHLT
jgi:hypothetical protein